MISPSSHDGDVEVDTAEDEEVVVATSRMVEERTVEMSTVIGTLRLLNDSSTMAISSVPVALG